jgi:serine/threonine protein kinase
MSKNGVSEVFPFTLVDDHKNQFVCIEKLGRGAQGTVYLAKVDELYSKNLPIKEGQYVAIKVMGLEKENPDYKDRLSSMQREIECLHRSKNLLSVKSSSAEENPKTTYIIMPYNKGVDLRETIYDTNGPHGAVAGKIDLSPEMRDLLAYELIRKACEIQQAGIVYADYKPDHFLFDKGSGKLAVIDFGQSFVGSEPTPHEFFQNSGWMYAPPEVYEPNGQFLPNTMRTDAYVLGLLVAALYSDQCYELETDSIKLTKDSNPALQCRGILKDILGEDIDHKAGMPDDLFQIVRHLMQVDPAKRPVNIACANGMESSENLKDLRSAWLVESMVKELTDLTIGSEGQSSGSDVKKKRALIFSRSTDKKKHKVAEGIIQKAIDILKAEKNYPYLDPNAVNKITTQIVKDIETFVNTGKLTMNEAQRYLKKIEEINKNFNIPGSELSSKSAKSSKP